MKALWVHNFPPTRTSSGVFMFVLADALRKIGVDVHLHYTGSLRRAWRIPAAAKKVKQLSTDFDIAHAQFGSACALVTSRAACPKVLSLRGTDLLGSDTGGLSALLHGQVVKRMTRYALPAFERVFVMSRRMQSELAKFHGVAEGVEIVPDGINLDQFQPMPREEARQRLGLGNDQRPWALFASLSADNPLKRPNLAREAVRIATQKRPELQLKTLSGKTHDEVVLWMNAADTLLLTSTREGWPNVVKESLACNTPFVATDVSDLAEIAQKEPSCTVTEAKPEALAAGILRAIDAPRSPNLRAHIQSMNAIDIATEIRSLYEDIADQRQLAAA